MQLNNNNNSKNLPSISAFKNPVWGDYPQNNFSSPHSSFSDSMGSDSDEELTYCSLDTVQFGQKPCDVLKSEPMSPLFSPMSPVFFDGKLLSLLYFINSIAPPSLSAPTPPPWWHAPGAIQPATSLP